MVMVAPPVRRKAPHTKLQPPRPARPLMEDADALAAQAAIDTLEDWGAVTALRLLADAYARLAEGALLDAAVMELYDRFKAAASARDRHAVHSDVRATLEDLRARGIAVYDQDEPGTHPVDLRRVGAVLGRLSRQAREAVETVGA